MTERIVSRANPLVSHIRKLGRDRSYRREQGEFLCEGPKMLEEALHWGAELTTVVAAEELPLPRLPDGVRRVEVPAELLKSLAQTETPQGVLFLCRFPVPFVPDRLSGAHYLVLDGLQDPGNVGTIWRTADAFGCDGIFLVNHCVDPYNAKTVRATMGAVFRLPLWETEPDVLSESLGKADIPLYATALREDTEDVRQVKLTRAAVLIGSEGHGVSQEMLARCGKTIKIPMAERCESLNAAVAASVVLWEMCRNQ